MKWLGCQGSKLWWRRLDEEERWPHFTKRCFPHARLCLPLRKKPTIVDETLVDLLASAPMTTVVAPTMAKNKKGEYHPLVKLEVFRLLATLGKVAFFGFS